MKIYNTLSKKKEEFVPIEQNKVKIYVCGPTVYNYFHIGNARPFVFFDVVRRYFLYKGFEVTFVQNLTDIDDKIIAQAQKEGVDISQITDKYIKAFFEDTKALNIMPADENPKATDYIEEMIDFLAKLEKMDYAYAVDGDLYFEVSKFAEYGKLSGKKLEDLRAGARVEANSNKRNPADFTLWKSAKPGEPSWKSPWSVGRPGWHSECVVMSRDLLGDNFDIHGGGVDLTFPHHENELAQAEAVTGKQFVNYWMHNGFLNIEGEKMSKSLDNFFTARDILKQYDVDTIRFFFLSKHYRSPIDFNRKIMQESSVAIHNFISALNSVDYLSNREEIEKSDLLQEELASFIEAMDDDFNTAKALAVLFGLARKIKKESDSEKLCFQAAYTLIHLGRVLGLFSKLEEQIANLDKTVDETALEGLESQLIELLLSYRNDAKKEKNWALADKIRDDLQKLGLKIVDTQDGARVEK